MTKFRFLMMAFTLLFAMSIPTQLLAQNKKLIKEAKDGSGEAQAMLSTYYFKGIEGFDRDIEQAKFWAGKAEESARNGSWEAQAWLVSRLFHGDQVYRKNLNLALKWADATLNNKNLQGENRKVFVEFRERIVNEIEKENPGLVSSEKKSFKSMPQVGADHLPSPFTTEEMLEKISKHDKEGLDKLSIERVSGNNTSTYAFHCELQWFARDTYKEGQKMDDSVYSENCLQAYYGIKHVADNGNKEAQDFLNNPMKYFNIMDETGRIYYLLKQSGKADDFLSKFDSNYIAAITKAKEDYEQKAKKDERDIVKFLYAGDEYLELGTVLHKKNGVLKINTTDYTGGNEDTFTMNDGSVYIGTFKGKESRANENTTVTPFLHSYDIGILDLDELTPWNGTMKLPDGSYDRYEFGQSQNAKEKAEQAEKEKKREAVKKAQAQVLKSIQPDLARLKQKYGAATINSLVTTGALKVGYSMTMLNDYIAVYNKYMTARVKIENGRHDPLGLHYFEPTVSEVLKYGKTAKRMKLGGTMFANELVLANCMVANGKIAAIYQNTTILAIKDL